MGREELVRQFLRRHLPRRFEVESGFVFDAHGRVSRQMDVIVFDAETGPRFKASGGRLFVPCESAVCVGEVKSRIETKEEAAAAFANLRSAKELDRSAGGKNLEFYSGKPVDQEKEHLDQLFAFVFIVSSALRESTMRSELLAEVNSQPRHLWPNVIFAFDKYLLTFCCQDGVCPNPLDALGIGSVKPSSKRHLLLEFFLMVAQAIVVTTVPAFSYFEHLRGSVRVGGPVFPFEEDGG